MNPRKVAFRMQKWVAGRRGIPFELSFMQWSNIWLKSRKFHLRGRSSAKYCMARFFDQGAYKLGNVKITTNGENITEALLRRVTKPETRRKLSLLAKQRGFNKINLGRQFTDEHRRNNSESLKGRIFSKRHKINISKARKGQPWSAKRIKLHLEKYPNSKLLRWIGKEQE